MPGSKYRPSTQFLTYTECAEPVWRNVTRRFWKNSSSNKERLFLNRRTTGKIFLLNCILICVPSSNLPLNLRLIYPSGYFMSPLVYVWVFLDLMRWIPQPSMIPVSHIPIPTFSTLLCVLMPMTSSYYLAHPSWSNTLILVLYILCVYMSPFDWTSSKAPILLAKTITQTHLWKNVCLY